MPHPPLRLRPTIAKGMGFFQVVLLTIAMVCLAFTYAVMDRNKATRDQLKPVIENLEQLRENKAISSAELYAITDQFKPLMYPILYDPWLLRNTLPIGSACIILHSLLMMIQLRWKSQALHSQAAPAQDTVNG